MIELSTPSVEVVQRLPESIRSRIAFGPDCWTWLGHIGPTGYGRWEMGARTIGAHKAVYELVVGPVPSPLVLDHLCHLRDEWCAGGSACPHRACTNPGHLTTATIRENVLRGRGPTAVHARLTHCPSGHELAGGNLYLHPNGRERRCRQCSRGARVRYKAKIAAREGSR